MIPQIDINTILADPLLLTGSGLFIFGIIAFIFSLVKFITFKEPSSDFLIPDSEETPTATLAEEQPDLLPEQESPAGPIPQVTQKTENVIAETPAPKIQEDIIPQESAKSLPPKNQSMEETVVLPPYIAETQAQIEICITQIKQLNKKVIHLEEIAEELYTKAQNQSSAQTSTVVDNPSTAITGDFSQKLLKLAEHVIVLEKEVARLRQAERNKSASPENPGKPPVMPL